MRTGQKADGKSPFEKLYGRKPNTVKSNVVERIKNVSETEPKVTFCPSDFEEEIDSTIQVSERTKESKLDKGGEGAERNGTHHNLLTKKTKRR